MPFSDEDESGRSKRRRGRSRDDDRFDDFWARESIGPPGRSRRRRGASEPAGDPGDVSDLTGTPSAPGPSPVPPRPSARDPRRAPAGRDPRPRRPPRVPDATPARSPSPAAPAGPPADPLRPPRRAGSGRSGPPPGGGRAAGPPPRYPVGAQAALERRRALEHGDAPGGLGAGPAPSSYGASRRPVLPEAPLVTGPPPTRQWAPDDGYGDDAYGHDYDPDQGFDDVDSYGQDYDDYGDAELDELPKRRGCRRALTALAVLVVLAMVAGWFGWAWVQDRIDPPGGPGETVIVEVPEGTSTAGVGDVLADAGVIRDATVWDWYTKLRDVGTIKAGSYEMQLNSSFDEAIDALKAEPLPPEVELLVTIPPGLTEAQIATRLADPEDGVPGFTVEAVQAALDDPASRSGYLPADQASLEGTLYPETYAVEEGDTPAVVVQRMVHQFDEVANGLDLNGRAAALGMTPYQVLIIASMVEREAGIPEDGPRVARVIYNRLAAGEPLAVDATSCYEKGEIPCELTTADLEDNSPYDTRQRAGLPPTPIASPGRASIEAALSPADGDWRWYVLDAEANDRSSFFTNDYDEFLAAKERCAEAGLGCG